MDQVNEWQADVDELRSFLSLAKRRKVKTLLNNEIAMLENKILNATPTEYSQPAKISTTTLASVNKTSQANFRPITSYGFEQTEDDVIHVYISLKGVSESTRTELSCTEQSFELKIYGVVDPSDKSINKEEKNYRLQIARTDGTIDKDKSFVKVKPDRVIVNLIKTSERHWLQLSYKKQVGEDFDAERDDPAKGLMGMMKQLYEEGDEDMKKTIAQTWTNNEKQKNKYAFPSRKEMMRN